jgi:hypothetical protein
MPRTRRADTAVAFDVYPRQPQSNLTDSTKNQPVAQNGDVHLEREVNESEAVEILKTVLARKLREFDA